MQKAIPEIFENGLQESFLIRTFGHEAFRAPYNHHPEYELTYIVRGQGKRYIGNHLSDFSDGDFVLIGPDQPHCWLLDKDDPMAKSIVIQFAYDVLGKDCFEKPEFSAIQKMLKESSAGLSFPNSKAMTKFILRLRKSLGAKRIIYFLELLDALSNQEYHLINTNALTNTYGGKAEANRINIIMAYIIENYKNNISLEDVANVANLTPNAFCKFFKKLTGKTFIDMVIQYRMNFVIQQLLHTDHTIGASAVAAGFHDMSYFYKTFKEKLGMSPNAYRKKVLQ